MAEIKKLQEIELKRLQEFQSNMEGLIKALGQIELKKKRILKDEDSLNVQFELLSDEELSISNYIKNNYGNINVDLKTGEFTYSKE
tara:strand:- start:2286 stop:2543 length:258 start_codon:yes stop_codon:yes gene_type:complete